MQILDVGATAAKYANVPSGSVIVTSFLVP